MFFYQFESLYKGVEMLLTDHLLNRALIMWRAILIMGLIEQVALKSRSHRRYAIWRGSDYEII
jgi:hypothetical protein